MIIVNLVSASPLVTPRNERTYIDNISGHGARVHSTAPWQLGQQAEIAPASGETPMQGEVVYCQKLAEDRFFIGLKFRSHIPWPALQRFNGVCVPDLYYTTRHL